MGEATDLWGKVENRCLKQIFRIAKQETLTEEDLRQIRSLAEIAIQIDMLNLRWEAESRQRRRVLRVLPGPAFSPPKAES